MSVLTPADGFYCVWFVLDVNIKLLRKAGERKQCKCSEDWK
jgi:hypothetical protein